MDIFNGMLSNPNFGNLFRGSSHARELFNRQWKMSMDPNVASLRAKVSVDVNDEGKLVFRSTKLDYKWTQGPNETPSEMMGRVLRGEGTEAFDPARGYGLTGVRTSEFIEGAQPIGGRRTLGEISERMGVNIHLRTFDPGGESYRRAEALVAKGKNDEMMGLIFGGDDKHRLIEMFDKQTGARLTQSQILEKWVS